MQIKENITNTSILCDQKYKLSEAQAQQGEIVRVNILLYLVKYRSLEDRRRYKDNYQSDNPSKPPVTWHLRQHRSAPPATGQRRRFTMVIGGQRRRSTTVNAANHRSTPADHGGDRRSTVAVNDGRRWRTTVDCRWTTVDHHRTTGQRWLVGWSTIGSGSGLGRVRVGSATWHATCSHVSATCAHVASTWMLTWILSTRWESNAAP
nr:hypothetical protein [Tanacetum cinerariifolium]